MERAEPGPRLQRPTGPGPALPRERSARPGPRRALRADGMRLRERSLRQDPDLRQELASLARGCDFVLPSRFKKRLKAFQQVSPARPAAAPTPGEASGPRAGTPRRCWPCTRCRVAGPERQIFSTSCGRGGPARAARRRKPGAAPWEAVPSLLANPGFGKSPRFFPGSSGCECAPRWDPPRQGGGG